MDALRDLFDERIIEIMTLFLENPTKRYFLSDVSNKTKINITTTFRMLNRLVEKKFIKSNVIGKTRAYELEQNKKTQELLKYLTKKEDGALEQFLDIAQTVPRLKKIILESREKNSAKLILVGNFISTERLEKRAEEIKKRHHFEIKFVEISEEQYKKLRNFKSYGFDEKVIWERPTA